MFEIREFKKLVPVIYFCCVFLLQRFPGWLWAEEISWPFHNKFWVGANFSDFQNYSKVSYFHGGMDLRAPAGTPVYSPIGGTISISNYQIKTITNPPKFEYSRSPFLAKEIQNDKGSIFKETDYSARYVEICILDSVGRKWFLRHIDAQKIPQNVIARNGSNLPVRAGELLGTIISWFEPVYPENARFDHIHFEILDSQENYLNPAVLLPPIFDTCPPTIHKIWFVPNEENTTFSAKNGLPQTYGDIDIIANIDDTIDGARYLISPFKIAFSLHMLVASGSEEVIPHTVVYLFDKLPFKGDRTQLVTRIYKDYILDGKKRITSQGNSTMRRFLFVLTNGDFQTGYMPLKSFRTSDFCDGEYSITVEATDLFGNSSSSTQKFLIKNQ